MSTRQRIPSKSTEDVGDHHCQFNTNTDAFYVCMISSLFSVLGCGPSDALPGTRAAVHEWKPGSRELQQVEGLIIQPSRHNKYYISVHFCKPGITLKLNVWYVETSRFFQFSILRCDNAMFKVWLGLGTKKNHLVRVRKRSCVALKHLVVSPQTQLEIKKYPVFGARKLATKCPSGH